MSRCQSPKNKFFSNLKKHVIAHHSWTVTALLSAFRHFPTTSSRRLASGLWPKIDSSSILAVHLRPMAAGAVWLRWGGTLANEWLQSLLREREQCRGLLGSASSWGHYSGENKRQWTTPSLTSDCAINQPQFRRVQPVPLDPPPKAIARSTLL